MSSGWGSPVDPKTPEALALHFADNMDAKVKEALQR
jgi:3'-5' exoribonuclease